MLELKNESTGRARRLFQNAVAGAALLCILPLTANADPLPAGTPIDGVKLLDYFKGTDCSGAGGFSACYASQNGVNIAGDFESSAIYKSGSDGSSDFGPYPTIDGSEFSLTYNNDMLSWFYIPGTGDPAIHYFTVKQSNQFALFYSSTPIMSWSDNILNDLGYNGYSHVTWFNSVHMTSSGGPGGQEIPEPAALGLLGAGLLGLGLAQRRRKHG